MWRRILSSAQLRTLALATSSTAAAAVTASSAADRFLLAKSLPRFFSATTPVDTALKKKVEEIMPIATGHELEELAAEVQGKDILEINHPVGPFGTKEEPAIVKSYYSKRIVGCPGGEGEDEHDVVWFWLEKGKPHECPVCTQYFELEVVGPGGSPDHSDDHH
ncbi:cytochrome c oxidase subunit 5b-2, mitochondrial-like isoform X2 [Argentina anserina]|uniref:cytochrome c oxidase subunit 5b-2, mitochondrial-like isoform X2 n=1 Tax=Argentina anserina TaxID=57926 RepID=UPI00217621E7|nr:cytochrome c oxidase subunit 5b-2, mitochondrial-like isoform X2 [Potentilla anserina]